jgi:hypothetical protein
MIKNKVLYTAITSPFLLTILVVIFMLCISGEVAYRVNKSEEPKISSVDSLENVINQKDSIIEDLEYQVEIMSDEIQVRESEISYWGRKYDSTMIVINKYKRR